MRKLLTSLILVSLGGLLGFWLRHALASDATRIQWRLEEAVEGFNEADPRGPLRALAEDWRHADGLTRDELRDGLRWMVLQQRGAPLPHRVDLEDLEVQVDRSLPDSAGASFVLSFETLEQGSWSPSWRTSVEAQFQHAEGSGWRCIRSSHTTLESDGRFPGSR